MAETDKVRVHFLAARHRPGRIEISKLPHDINPVVLVQPDDGGEPIELRVSSIEVEGHARGVPIVKLELYPRGLNLSDREGVCVSGVYRDPGTRPVLFHELDIHQRKGAAIADLAEWVRSFRWRWTLDAPVEPIELELVDHVVRDRKGRLSSYLRSLDWVPIRLPRRRRRRR